MIGEGYCHGMFVLVNKLPVMWTFSSTMEKFFVEKTPIHNDSP